MNMIADIVLRKSDNTGTFVGAAARYAYTPKLRARLTELLQCENNRFFVMEDDICRAAQTTLTGAKHYMNSHRILVAIED